MITKYLSTMKKIRLYSRYKDIKTYYEAIDENKGVVTSNGKYVRCGLSEDNTKLDFIDFEGGPFLKVGSPFLSLNKNIKSIKTCYYIELE